MARELWASGAMGLRRLGTRQSELKALIEAAVTARQISEPLSCCLESDKAASARKWLDERRFDVAGVRRPAGDFATYFVRATQLQDGLVEDHATPITSTELMSDATPLPEVLRALKHENWRFILVNDTVQGIVTRADLNKPPVRIYLFGMISLLEMHLTYWLRQTYNDEGLVSNLSPGRVEKVQQIQRLRQEVGEDPLLVECLQFSDKRDLAFGDQSVCHQIGFEGSDSEIAYLRQVGRLRDILAHSNPDLAEGSTWSHRIELISWIETVLNFSDDNIERSLQSST